MCTPSGFWAQSLPAFAQCENPLSGHESFLSMWHHRRGAAEEKSHNQRVWPRAGQMLNCPKKNFWPHLPHPGLRTHPERWAGVTKETHTPSSSAFTAGGQGAKGEWRVYSMFTGELYVGRADLEFEPGAGRVSVTNQEDVCGGVSSFSGWRWVTAGMCDTGEEKVEVFHRVCFSAI